MSGFVYVQSAPGNEQVMKHLEAVSSNIEKELNIVVNKVANKGKSLIAKQVVKEYTTTQKRVRKAVKIRRDGLQRTLSLMGKKEWPAKYVKHRHTKAGVAATPLKNGQQAIFPKGFKGPKPGVLAEKLKGHAFERKGKETWIGKGKSRKRAPIQVLKVAGPINIAGAPIVTAPTAEQIKQEMEKQLAERLRYKSLVASGQIQGRTV